MAPLALDRSEKKALHLPSRLGATPLSTGFSTPAQFKFALASNPDPHLPPQADLCSEKKSETVGEWTDRTIDLDDNEPCLFPNPALRRSMTPSMPSGFEDQCGFRHDPLFFFLLLGNHLVCLSTWATRVARGP